MLRTAVLTGPDGFAELASSWRELYEDSPTTTPFQSFEWQETWWRHFGRGKRLRLLAFFEGNDLCGLMPLTLSRGPWNTMRAGGNLTSDYLHPLARRGYEREVAESVAAYATIAPGVDLIDLHQVREDQALASEGAFSSRTDQAKCLVLDLPPTFDAYLATLGKSLRYDVRRLERDPFKSGAAAIAWADESNVQESLDILFATHKARWRKRGLPGAFLARSERFHRDWAAQAVAAGHLWLSVLRLDGEPLGALYAMKTRSTCFYYQAGFNPSKGGISPGTLLVGASIRRSIEDGMTTFDFLRGDEPYKRRWKPQRVLSNLRLTQAVSPGMGRLGLQWNGLGSHIEMRLRSRFEGRGLI